MKILKNTLAILIAMIMLASLFAGCAKGEGADKTNVVSENSTVNLDEITTVKEIITTAQEEPYAIVSELSQAKVDDRVKLGKYEQDNNMDNGQEEIVWRVLAIENSKALLLSEKILDCKPYNEKVVYFSWETCTLRGWLNNDFYNDVFSSTEKLGILTSTIVNNKKFESENDGKYTSDKLFLLSDSDVKNTDYGFSSDEFDINDNTVRIAYGTDFAKSNGLLYEDGIGSSVWWLRAPGFFIGAYGEIYYDGYIAIGIAPFSSSYGVRPALWINL